MDKDLKKWHVKSTGLLKRILVFYIGFLVISFFIWKIEALYIFTIPIGALIFYYATRNIVRKKTPLEIAIDSEKLILKYRKEKRELPIINLSYSCYGSDKGKDHYQVLTLYKSIIGSRGQTINEPVQELIGFRKSSSWTIQKLNEVRHELQEIGACEIKDRKTNFPLWERIMAS